MDIQRQQILAAQAKVDRLGLAGQKFEQPATPFRVGQLRSKVWRAPFTSGLTDLWRRRAFEYWERIERRFGVIMSEPRHAWEDDPEHGPVVATYATPLLVIPGERFIVPAGERIIH